MCNVFPQAQFISRNKYRRGGTTGPSVQAKGERPQLTPNWRGGCLYGPRDAASELGQARNMATAPTSRRANMTADTSAGSGVGTSSWFVIAATPAATGRARYAKCEVARAYVMTLFSELGFQ
jgi:hypothetical protein